MKKRGVKNNVRQLRRALDITQEEFARRIDVTRQTVIAIEKQRYEPTVGVALNIARHLKHSVEDVFWIEGSDGE